MLPDDLLFRGFALFKSGKYQEAANYFRLLTLQVPAEGRYWVTLAHTLRKCKEPLEAIEAYKVALILGQDQDPETLLSLAELLKDKGEEEEAKSCLEEAMRLTEKHPSFYKHLSFIHTTWFSKTLQRL